MDPFTNPVGQPNPASQPPVMNEPPRTRPRKTFFAIIILIVLLIAAGIAYAFAYGINIKSLLGMGAPYEPEHIISGVLQGMSKIDSSSYAMSLTGKLEPISANAAVYNAPAISAEEQAKYDRDKTRFQDVQTILTKLGIYTGYGTKTKKYPSTLTAAGVPSALATKYSYVVRDQGKDFALTATFETPAAVKEATRYSFSSLVSDMTVTFTKNSSSYYFFTGRPDESSLASSLRDIDQSLKSIPSNYNLNFTVSGASQVTNNDKYNAQIKLSGGLTASIISFDMDAELRKVGDSFYFLLTKFPSMPWVTQANTDAIMNKWVKFDESDLSKYGFGTTDPKEFNKEFDLVKEKFSSQMKTLIEVAERNNVIATIGAPARDQVGGSTAYRYDLTLNKETMGKFLQDLGSTFRQKYGSESMIDAQALADAEEYVESPEFNAVFDYMTKNSSVSIWVRPDGIPIKYSYSLRLVPNSQAITSGRQLTHTMTLTLSDVNRKITIEEPKSAISLESFISEIGSMQGYGTSPEIIPPIRY